MLATRRRHLLERLHLEWLRPRRRGFVRPRRRGFVRPERLHLEWLRPRRRGFVRPRRSLVAWRSPCRTRTLRCHRVQAHSGSSPARFLTLSSQPRSNLRPRSQPRSHLRSMGALPLRVRPRSMLGMLHASPSRSTLWTPSHRLLPKPSRSPLQLRERDRILKAERGMGDHFWTGLLCLSRSDPHDEPTVKCIKSIKHGA